MVYGTDGIIQVDTLTAPFKGDKCRELAGKPKLFFIQVRAGDFAYAAVSTTNAST